MLKELSPQSLWIAEMPFVAKGFELGARMTVVRLSNGDLFVCSPIELTPQLRSELDALGPVRYIISPNKFHFLDLPDFSRAYPDAKVYVSPQSSGKSLPGIPPRPEEPGQIILSHAPEPAWADDLDQIIFKGMPMVNEVIFFHKQSRTLILTDLCFYIDESTSLLTRLLARSLGVYKKFGPSRTVKMMIRDRRAAQSSLERIMDWDFDRIILAHGRIVESGGKASFGKAFASFLQ